MDKIWWIILIVLLPICLSIGPSESPDDFSKALPFCRSSSNINAKANGANRALIIVSTLDGHISAIDAKSGKVTWTFSTEPGTLLSSSLNNIEGKRNSEGKSFRLIPALDGSLYQFDGQNLEALPFTAETLLSSSVKLGDGMIVTGCNENRVYGIDHSSGKLQYECSSEGCKNSENISSEDVIVVRRRTHVIRAIDPRTGLEKWNYSVGHHDVAFYEKALFSCSSDNEAEQEFTRENGNEENLWFYNNLSIKFVPPTGQVMGVLKDNPSVVLWQHQFKTPMVDAWSLHQNNLDRMDLLSSIHTSTIPVDKHSPIGQPALYIGVHQKQVYIKHSPAMLERVSQSALQNLIQGSHSFPRVQWKPYLVTAISRTPVINSEIRDDKSTAIGFQIPQGIDNAALMVYEPSEYPYEGGFLIYYEETPNPACSLPPRITGPDDNETLPQIVYVSLSHWWKELTVSVICFLILNFFVTRLIMKRWKKTVIMHANNNNNANISNNNAKAIISLAQIGISPLMAFNDSDSKLNECSTSNDVKNETFTSRYLTDFEPIQCLGRGGFGVVFQARNKIDDCDYAIKRICLPNREDAREKVMREVKALAKLDHPGIVRYYNAWLESPPVGWQEALDKQWEAKGMLTPSACLSSEASLETSPYNKPSAVNPLHPFDSSLVDNEKELLKSCKQSNNDFSKGFYFPAKIKTSQEEESGSFSYERKRNTLSPDNSSWEELFCTEKEDFSVDKSTNNGGLPFERYTKTDTSSDSFIVFEDSGCAEKNGYSDGGVDLETSLSKSVENENFSKGNGNRGKSVISRPASLATSDAADLFRKSSSAMQNIPKMYLHIQMQLCKKENLKDWLAVSLERDRLQVLDFFDQIVSAVEYVHEQGLIHRDLKPSNIFFSMDGTIKIGDFGLVATMSEETGQHTPCGDGPKHHTDQVGTQLYMSPEQTMGQLYSQKVDIFSLGLIFFELIIPFYTQMERLRVMLDLKQLEFPKNFMEDQPEECLFVKGMLSHDPEKRPSAVDIRKHALLQLFQPRPEILRHRRSRNLSRTFSTSSSGSVD